MTPRLPILRLQLLNEAIDHSAAARIDRLVKAKDLLRQYPQACRQEGVDVELFHNEQVRYSGIQVDCHLGGTEWTAIGLPAVKALVLWYQIAQHQGQLDCAHVIESTEFYTPQFLDQPQAYRLHNFILSKNVRQELQQLRSPQAQKERLEKYLFGNIMTFFNFIGFSYDKEQHFLEVSLQQFRQSGRPLPIFRQQHKASFNIDFRLNFRLPQALRLGQSTALGYGRVSWREMSGERSEGPRRKRPRRHLQNTNI